MSRAQQHTPKATVKLWLFEKSYGKWSNQMHTPEKKKKFFIKIL